MNTSANQFSLGKLRQEMYISNHNLTQNTWTKPCFEETKKKPKTTRILKSSEP